MKPHAIVTCCVLYVTSFCAAQVTTTQQAPLAATLPAATQPAAQVQPPVNLLAGVTWLYSTDGGATFNKDVPEEIKPPAAIAIKCDFDLPALDKDVVSLDFSHNLRVALDPAIVINGKIVDYPLVGMHYRTIHGIGPAMLKAGRNELLVKFALPADPKAGMTELLLKVALPANAKKPVTFPAADFSLLALKPCHLKIQTGPILGAFGDDYFTVTFRTNIPSEAGLTATKLIPSTSETQTAGSFQPDKSLIHRMRLDKKDFLDYTEYWAGADCRKSWVRADISFPKIAPKTFSFVALGDNRPSAENWRKISLKVLDAKPAFVVHTGDLVPAGTDDQLWDTQFATPAREMLAAIPMYAVIGNHEQDCRLFDELFYCPTADGHGRNWSQQMGSMLLVGLDGDAKDWQDKDSKSAKWLSETLAASKAKFIFVACHYPPYSSAVHGKLDKDGNPAEKDVRTSRDIVMPILEKYHATAYLVGHDHCYERSQAQGGVTVICTGGAGIASYQKTQDAARQNPHSKFFICKEHYCIFDIKDDACTMKAVSLQGETIDTITWKARESK